MPFSYSAKTCAHIEHCECVPSVLVILEPGIYWALFGECSGAAPNGIISRPKELPLYYYLRYKFQRLALSITAKKN